MNAYYVGFSACSGSERENSHGQTELIVDILNVIAKDSKDSSSGSDSGSSSGSDSGSSSSGDSDKG